MNETNTASNLRNQVVTEVVRAIIGLTFVLYVAVFTLLLTHRTVPGELWLAAGNASGILGALLVNSKNDTQPATADTAVVTTADTTVTPTDTTVPAPFDPAQQQVVDVPDATPGVPVDA